MRRPGNSFALANTVLPLVVYFGPILTSLVPSRDPGRSDEESERIAIAVANADAGRADLAVSGSVDAVVNGGGQITASIQSLDTPNVMDPTLAFTLSDGVTLRSMPAGCMETAEAIECQTEDISSDSTPSPTASVILLLDIDRDADDPSVTVRVTSQFNSAGNDPFPPNNIMTLWLR